MHAPAKVEEAVALQSIMISSCSRRGLAGPVCGGSPMRTSSASSASSGTGCAGCAGGAGGVADAKKATPAAKNDAALATAGAMAGASTLASVEGGRVCGGTSAAGGRCGAAPLAGFDRTRSMLRRGSASSLHGATSSSSLGGSASNVPSPWTRRTSTARWRLAQPRLSGVRFSCTVAPATTESWAAAGEAALPWCGTPGVAAPPCAALPCPALRWAAGVAAPLRVGGVASPCTCPSASGGTTTGNGHTVSLQEGCATSVALCAQPPLDAALRPPPRPRARAPRPPRAPRWD
jgi:hypothetical protein